MFAAIAALMVTAICLLTSGSVRVTAQPYINFGGPGGPPSTGDCFKDFQFLQRRFSYEQLQFFCQQWRSYSEQIYVNVSIHSTFTEAQQEYVRSLQVDLSATTNSQPMAVRKEYRLLTEHERNLFHFVVRSLKQQKIDGVSKYDLLVALSHPVLAPGAHVGAAFLPWHREYLRTFEAAMQKINTFASLPFWDTTLDEGLPDASQSILWEPDFLGNGDGPVTSGPFAGWLLQTKPIQDFDNATADKPLVPLTRNISKNGRLMSPDDVDYILTRTEFRQFSACLDLRLEQGSRYTHEWVGGDMGEVNYAASDPVFFLFHAFVDYLWEEWRRSINYEQRVLGYPPNYEACTKYHFGNTTMAPFESLTNADGLSDGYTKLYFTYQNRPVCSAQQSNCLSSLLFCDRKRQRCLSKISAGGDCAGMEDYDPCYKSLCVEGRCVEPSVPSVQLLNDTELPTGQPVSNGLGGDKSTNQNARR